MEARQHRDGLILVGRVVGVHGIRGEIKILAANGCDEKKWKNVQLIKTGQVIVCNVIESRLHSGVILTRLKDYNDRDKAGSLIGFDVFVEKSELPQLSNGEYYAFQLEGMTVVTDSGKNIGVITDIFPTGSNDVYVVKGGYGEILLPATKDVILKIDLDSKIMTVHMLEGLMPGENEI